MPARIFSCVFSPKPLSACTWSASQAARSIVERRDAELLVQRGRLLRAQPGNADQRQHAAGNLRPQLLEHRDRAGVEQLADLLGQVLADAFDVGQVAVRIGRDVGERLGQVADPPRRVAIGPHAKRIGVLELEQVGDFVEGGGDVAVVHAAIVEEGGEWEQGRGAGASLPAVRCLATSRHDLHAARCSRVYTSTAALRHRHRVAISIAGNDLVAVVLSASAHSDSLLRPSRAATL